MVDIAVLMQFLVPALPFLVKAGDKALDGAITKMGEDAWYTAKAIWERLMPKVETDPTMKKAVEKAVTDPENADRQTALRLALQDFLKENPDVADDLEQFLDEKLPTAVMEQKVVTQTIGKMDGGSKAVASIENVRGNVSL